MRMSILLSVALAVLALGAPTASAKRGLGDINHFVVIYEENHSFDNLYGGWGRVGGDAVNGATAPAVRQVAQDRTA